MPRIPQDEPDNMADLKASTLPPAATYEELAQHERDFDNVDQIVAAANHLLTTLLYARRATTISKIPNFWPLVFEQAPPDIDQYIQPSDSAVFASTLTNFSVSRFEIPDDASVAAISGADTKEGKGQSTEERLRKVGEPRSFGLRFEFSENEYFSDTVLEKKFWHRRLKDGGVALVSVPVKIHWKKKDLTEGLTDAAFALWEAEQKSPGKEPKDLKEYAAVKKLVEGTTEGAQSFFALFGFRGMRVDEEEHRAAEGKMRRGERLGGDVKYDENVEANLEDEEEMIEGSETEVFRDGDDLARALAEDLWPNALSFFANAQEVDDEDLSELEVDSADEEDDEEMDIPDIRSLVKDSERKGSIGQQAPPAKKRKT